MYEIRKDSMNDTAELDPRSVAAMLLGHGDGRERLYQFFTLLANKRFPNIGLEDLDKHYANFCARIDNYTVLQRLVKTGVGRGFLVGWYVDMDMPGDISNARPEQEKLVHLDLVNGQIRMS